RWAETVQLTDAYLGLGSDEDLNTVTLRQGRAVLDAGRGDSASALAHVRAARRLSGDMFIAVQYPPVLAAAEAEVAAWQGRLEDAAATVAGGLAALQGPLTDLRAFMLLALGLRVEAERVALATARPDDDTVDDARLVAAVLLPPAPLPPGPGRGGGAGAGGAGHRPPRRRHRGRRPARRRGAAALGPGHPGGVGGGLAAGPAGHLRGRGGPGPGRGRPRGLAGRGGRPGGGRLRLAPPHGPRAGAARRAPAAPRGAGRRPRPPGHARRGGRRCPAGPAGRPPPGRGAAAPGARLRRGHRGRAAPPRAGGAGGGGRAAA